VYPYDSGAEPIQITPQGTYADPNARLNGVEYWWNHGIGTIVTSLIRNGLRIESLNEYPFSPYNVGNMRQRHDGNWEPIGAEGKIPVLFSIKAIK